MLQFMENLQADNNFYVDHTGLQMPAQRQMNLIDQRNAVEYIINLASGSVYIEHMAWLDFRKFELPKPIYINLVRDPVERLISWYYYVRNSYKNAIFYRKNPNATIKPAKWFKKSFNDCVRSGDAECQYIPYSVTDEVSNFKRQTLFFCGHEPDCLPFNSPLAVQMAKRNVEREYAVVGTWEETNITLAVLEAYIPRYFANGSEIYQQNMAALQNRNRNNRKPSVDADVKQMIRRNLTEEYDFYYFCKQRLYRQYLALKNGEENLD